MSSTYIINTHNDKIIKITIYKKITIVKNWIIKLLCFVFLTGLTSTELISQNNEDEDLPLNRILFVFDASGSMFAMWENDTRINIAKRLLTELVDSLERVPNVQMALRVFGHQSRFPPQDCTDTALEVPFGPDNAWRIRRTIDGITPRGTTPIARTLEESANDFPPCDNCRNIIILLTDGKEKCGGDPCEVSQKLQKKGIFLRPFVIGVGKDFAEEFDCVGTYFHADTEAQFISSLRIIISQALEATSSQVNLLDKKGNPTETNIPITFYNSNTGNIEDQIVHTLNHRGFPDTLYFLDVAKTYDMVVHTIPPVRKNNIVLAPGKHNTIAADTPQGGIEVVFGGRATANYPVIVRKSGSMETLNVQHTGEKEKYLTGNYDLEIHSLPRINVDNIEVEQDHVTTVEIPQPGVASVRLPSSGYASILKINENGEVELIYRFKDNIRNESLSMMPGDYYIVFRSRASSQTHFSVEQHFRIESGVTTNIRLR